MITLAADRPADLLAVRFATSPAWETALAVRAWAYGEGGVVSAAWATAAAGRAAELDLGPLLAVNPRRGWVPDFLTPPPRSPAPRLGEELAEIRRTPAAVVERDLRRCRGSVSDAAARAQLDRLLADPAAAPVLLADRLEAAWRVLVRPFWPRIRTLLSADVARRGQLLAERGLGRVLDDLDRRIGWSGTAVTVEAPEELEARLDERGVVLMPSAFVWPHVVAVTGEPWQPTIVYPARGIGRLWERAPTPSRALTGLLGRTRAVVLAGLDAPASTTAVAARLGLGASGASRHLTALRDAGLVAGVRHGHEVRYARTRLGDTLVRAAGSVPAMGSRSTAA